MIRILGKIPNTCFMACSGGIDSMVALDFLLRGRKNVTVVHFNHGTTFGAQALPFVREFCANKGVPIIVNNISRERSKGESKEAYWRTERYKFFNLLPGKVVTAHTLDDAVEWWLFSSLHGNPKVMTYENSNVIRPFLMTSKKKIVRWAEKNNIPYMDDPSNKDEKYMRSIIRHKILPEALRVNPGLHKVVLKKIRETNE